MAIPRGAVIEIVERRPKPSNPSGDVITPNDIRINGQSVLCPADSPVEIHGINVGEGDAVLVTLTLFASRVVIAAEDTEETRA